MIPFEKVSGKDKGNIKLFALSTCIWCRKTRRLLEELGIAYEYVYVDLLDGDDKKETIEELTKWNADCSYPTLVINNKTCIIGFEEDDIRKNLS
ncbi:MAG: glutaredoxin family protein [Brevinematales bacterium]